MVFKMIVVFGYELGMLLLYDESFDNCIGSRMCVLVSVSVWNLCCRSAVEIELFKSVVYVMNMIWFTIEIVPLN